MPAPLPTAVLEGVGGVQALLRAATRSPPASQPAATVPLGFIADHSRVYYAWLLRQAVLDH
jgi:hypothetical protein